MKILKDSYVAFSVVFLMLIRPFVSGAWFASIEIFGFLIAWLDILRRFISECTPYSDKGKTTFATIFLVMAVVGLLLLVLSMWNLIVEILWLNDSLLLDEISLLALLASLSQDNILHILNSIVIKRK